MRAICYIPAIECLAYYEIGHWLDIFQERAGVPATEICLPAVTASSGSYRSRFFKPHPRLSESNHLERWIADAKERGDGLTVWASVVATLPTLVNEENALRDQWHEPMEDVCITNPHVQRLIAEICTEIRGIGADGVALDVTDAYPNSTSSRYPGADGTTIRYLQNTCFCRYCMDDLRTVGSWNEGPELFQGERSLSRFVLKPTPTGATPIEVKFDWLDRLDAASLTAYGRARGFIDEASDEEVGPAALKLLRYLVARGKVTAQSIKRLTASASESGLRTAVMLGSYHYDMSQMTSATMLAERAAMDEIWAPNFEPDRSSSGATSTLRFLHTRGSYYLNTLFENLNDITFLVSQIEDPESIVSTLCRNIAALDRRDNLTIGQCAQMEFYGIQGYVGAPLAKADVISLMNKLVTDGSLPERIRTEIVTRVQQSEVRLGAAEEDVSKEPRMRGPYD